MKRRACVLSPAIRQAGDTDPLIQIDAVASSGLR
jgi:hypothetical protein